MTDQEIENLNRGGHDPLKVFNAFKSAYDCKDKPTVILAFTVKVWNRFSSRQADNSTHQVKKLTNENLNDFVIKSLILPIDIEKLKNLEYLKFDKHSDEFKYLISQRQKLEVFYQIE